MIRHLVFFKLAELAEGNAKSVNARLIKEGLEGLRKIIPVVRKLEVHLNCAESAVDNYDVFLDSEFDSLSDLKAYSVHPDHLKVVGFINKVKIARAALDYEL